MVKMTIFSLGLVFVVVAAQVLASNAEIIQEERTQIEETNRSLLDLFGFGFLNLRAKCQARVNRISNFLPTTVVSLTRLANGGVYYFPPATALTTYQGAKAFCAEHGMHLVTLNSDYENSLVFARAKALLLAGAATASPGAWIGLRDAGTLNYQWLYNNGASNLWYFATSPTTAGFCAYYLQSTPEVTDPTKSWGAKDCTTSTTTFICEMEPPCSALLPSVQV